MSRVFVTISVCVVFREMVKLGRNVSTRSKTYWESVSTSVLPSKGSARVGTSPSPSILGTSSNAALPSRIERKCFATVRHSGPPWTSSVKTSAHSKCGRTRWEKIMQQGGAVGSFFNSRALAVEEPRCRDGFQNRKATSSDLTTATLPRELLLTRSRGHLLTQGQRAWPRPSETPHETTNPG